MAMWPTRCCDDWTHLVNPLDQPDTLSRSALEEFPTRPTYDVMNTLYDSESFVVVHLQAPGHDTFPAAAADTRADVPTMPRHGFEIVDKRSGKEVYLDGSWAELFQQHLDAWQRNSPTQEEVEATLEQYSGLAQQPVLVH